MTTKDIILKYLQRRTAEGISIVSSYHIEQAVPEYGRIYCDTTRLPSAYSRVWRKIREKEEYKTIGILELKELKERGLSKNKMKTWQIIT